MAARDAFQCSPVIARFTSLSTSTGALKAS
jgi:hypothetical protein